MSTNLTASKKLGLIETVSNDEMTFELMSGRRRAMNGRLQRVGRIAIQEVQD